MASQCPWRIGGAVGLGIVAAMSEDSAHHSERPPAAAFPRSQLTPVSPPLFSVPVLSISGGQSPAPAPQMGIGEDQESEDLSECYTCVISHVGGNHVRRMEYFDDGYGDSGVFCGLAPPERQIPMSPSNFLSVCNLCRKELHGVDIFIYKGEKAFCSAECRYQQINSDEQNEQKQGSKAMKSLKLSLRASPFSVIERGCSIVSYSTAPRHTNLYV